MKKLIVAFRNFVNVPKKKGNVLYSAVGHVGVKGGEGEVFRNAFSAPDGGACKL